MAFDRLKFNTDFEVWLDRRLLAIKKSEDSTTAVSDIKEAGEGSEGADDSDGLEGVDLEEFGEFETHLHRYVPRQQQQQQQQTTTTMSFAGAGKKAAGGAGNYYKSVWVGDDDEDWDGSLASLDYSGQGAKTRERVAQILKETELADEEQTVFSIPNSSSQQHKRQNSHGGASVKSTGSFEDKFNRNRPNVTPSNAKYTGNFDSHEHLESMHDFTENGYVEIGDKQTRCYQRRSNEEYFEDDDWSFDGDEGDRGFGDGASSSEAGRSPSTKTPPYKAHPTDQELQSVRFRKFGQLEDNYIDDDEFQQEPEEMVRTEAAGQQVNGKHQPIARAILPMETELEMEVEDDVEMIDSERNHEYTYRFTHAQDTTSDTEPIVFKVDQESLNLQHSKQIRRGKRLRLALFIIILLIAIAALGAIVYFIIRFNN